MVKTKIVAQVTSAGLVFVKIEITVVFLLFQEYKTTKVQFQLLQRIYTADVSNKESIKLNARLRVNEFHSNTDSKTKDEQINFTAIKYKAVK